MKHDTKVNRVLKTFIIAHEDHNAANDWQVLSAYNHTAQ